MFPTVVLFNEFEGDLVPRDFLKEVFGDAYEILVRFLYDTCELTYPREGCPYEKIIEFIIGRNYIKYENFKFKQKHERIAA